MAVSFYNFRGWLDSNGLLPRSRVAFITLYLSGLNVLLVLLQKAAALLHSSFGTNLGGWIFFLSIVISVLLCVLGARWASSRLLWRLRNRLMITYLFIGVI